MRSGERPQAGAERGVTVCGKFAASYAVEWAHLRGHRDVFSDGHAQGSGNRGSNACVARPQRHVARLDVMSGLQGACSSGRVSAAPVASGACVQRAPHVGQVHTQIRVFCTPCTPVRLAMPQDFFPNERRFGLRTLGQDPITWPRHEEAQGESVADTQHPMLVFSYCIVIVDAEV